MTVDQGLYPPGRMVRVVREGLPFVGRVVEDDPVNARAKVRIETTTGVMHAYAMTTLWVTYDRLAEHNS